MTRIAVLTSGGDAPGMNAAIRAVVRTGAALNMETYGVREGFAGLVRGDFRELGRRDVGDILQHGGTVLGTARSERFRTDEGVTEALDQLKSRDIDGLVVIGGNGSQTGSLALTDRGFPVIGIASTIDNDLNGTDISIGVDTALDVALDAIDRLRVTASSHRKASAVETMGRDCGYLALMAGLAGGADCILIPEVETDPADVARTLRSAHARGKNHAMLVVAEGADYNLARLMRYFREEETHLGFTLRETRLGHIQRGGTPGAADRILAAKLGYGAVKALERGEAGVLVGIRDGAVATTPLRDVVGKPRTLEPGLVELAGVLAQ